MMMGKISGFVPLPALCTLLCAAPLFLSCSADVSGKLEKDSSGILTLKAELGSQTAKFFHDLGTLQNKGPAAVLDAQALNRSLGGAPGIASAALKSTGPEALEGTVTVSRAGDFLSAGKSRLVVYENRGGGGRLAISLGRESGQEILGLVSRDLLYYLSNLMAPIATGEKLSKSRYLELVRSIWGDAIADEIDKASVKIALSLPGPVKSVKGGSFSGREARFQVRLLDILVLETPLDYEILW